MSIESLKEWAKKNPEKVKESKKRYRVKHPRDKDRRKIESKKRRDKLRDELAAAQRKYAADNPQVRGKAIAYHCKCQAATAPKANNSRQLWIKSHIDIVASGRHTYQELAIILGRSYRAIKARRSWISHAQWNVEQAGERGDHEKERTTR